MNTNDQDIFGTNDSATSIAPANEEELFDIDRDHPEPEYDNPPMTVGENSNLELYGVNADDKQMNIKYRQPKHEGIAIENYKFGNGKQKEVLRSIIDRFDLKLRKASPYEDLVQQLRALEGTTITAFVTKADVGETLYNIDSKRS